MHRVELLVVKDRGVVIFRQVDILVFDVRDEIEMRGDWYGKWSGAVRPNLKWTTALLASMETEVFDSEK
jgi:lipopolysaccharide transport system ATP-binding protein